MDLKATPIAMLAIARWNGVMRPLSLGLSYQILLLPAPLFLLLGLYDNFRCLWCAKKKKLFSHVIPSAVKGFLMIARCFILKPRTTHAIVIASPSPKRMLYVTGSG
jgi:hypothetical protein